MLGFRDWVLKQPGLSFPVPANQWADTVGKWLLTDPAAQTYLNNGDFSVQNRTMTSFRVSLRSVGLPWEDFSAKWPIYSQWEALTHAQTGEPMAPRF